MVTVRVRRARPDEAGGLTRLMHELSAYQGEYASIIDGYEVAPDYIAQNPVYLAEAEGDGALLGFYGLLLEPPELDLMFVADRAQGLGVGRRLVDHMLHRAHDAGADHVRVVSHPPAEQFYVRMGAVRVAVLPPQPPKVTWERPELRFTVGGAATAQRTSTA
ncbi:GNAT family N-acetyltransferase [Streptodolium elevatio]